MSSIQPSRSPPIDQQHRIWFADTPIALPIAHYLDTLLYHYTTTGALVGPNDWATIEQSPRRNHLPSTSSATTSGVPSETSSPTPAPIFLLLERSRDENEPLEKHDRRTKKGKAGKREAGGEIVEGEDGVEGATVKDSETEEQLCCLTTTSSLEYTVKCSIGGKAAADFVRNSTSAGPPNGFYLLARMVLPPPPILPADNDVDGVIQELSTPVDSAEPDSIPMNLPPLSSQTSRHYTRSDIQISFKGSFITVYPNDSPTEMKRKFQKAGHEPGNFASLGIVNQTQNGNVHTMLAKWENALGAWESKCGNERLKILERERVIEIRNFEALQRAEKAETEIRKLKVRIELANLTGITNPEGLRQ
ncbi:hypothetical protein AGABI2DRAFT_181004 [Agaricus bisporus var. bisporus H97]|uniref:hypothetical protein n=1 Tax=Agaricus bisporus var. bisporus (strain H97 / ATCC MYA-4626 / FGSC 10389) TaxID=936046 RepID=UPI00029F53B2|nr:hypothetical protein AGABI2DRAFT_181004 [Agaricus bisporus var. bisporus H97]EKV42657.1 hypothetical protein AGABI2DRAFT_181004 [Agaricus bisporus var. bisporus H97]